MRHDLGSLLGLIKVAFCICASFNPYNLLVPREGCKFCLHILWQLYFPLVMETFATRESPGSLLPSEPNVSILPSFHNPPWQHLHFMHLQRAQWQVAQPRSLHATARAPALGHPGVMHRSVTVPVFIPHHITPHLWGNWHAWISHPPFWVIPAAQCYLQAQSWAGARAGKGVTAPPARQQLCCSAVLFSTSCSL